MNIYEQILVATLATALAVFLILAIILVVKLIGVVTDIKKVVATGQIIADKAEDVVENVKGITSVGGLVKTVVDGYTEKISKKKG